MRQWQNQLSSENCRTTVTNRRIWCPETQKPCFCVEKRSCSKFSSSTCTVYINTYMCDCPLPCKSDHKYDHNQYVFCRWYPFYHVTTDYLGRGTTHCVRLKIPCMKLQSLDDFFWAMEKQTLDDLYIIPKFSLAKKMAFRDIQVTESFFFPRFVLHPSSTLFHNTTALIGKSYLEIHKRKF